ncbi:MAG: VTT domain-containing protein [Desulfobacteraceae bacterium]|jgi:uncharacterized membrane protein YdjX (TVP38/TMEM64 family)
MFLRFVLDSRFLLFLAVLFLGGILLFLFWEPFWQWGHMVYSHLTDQVRIEAFIVSFGWAAPFIFIGIQILQVLFAPVPGEATGFIGGYLFGGIHGFIYSSIALSIGSWINFLLGRVLGERYVRRLISADKFARFDKLVRRQGIIVIFILFIFPGFPKDWLCLFLGVTSLPIKFFLIMATFGRMPGTLILSLQGAFLFEKNYLLLFILFGISLLVVVGTYLYRDKLYRWIEDSDK